MDNLVWANTYIYEQPIVHDPVGIIRSMEALHASLYVFAPYLASIQYIGMHRHK